MYEDSKGFRNASGCADPTPYIANSAMRREAWDRLCRCAREMLSVANRYQMRVDGLIPLTDRQTGISNHEPGGGCAECAI